MRRWLVWLAGLFAVALGAFLIFGPGYVEGSMNSVVPTTAKASAAAVALHAKLSIADMHSDTLMWKRSVNDLSERGHVDLPRLEMGNVALQVFSSVSKTPKGQNYDANGADTDNITPLVMAQLQPLRTWGSLLERSLWHAEKLQRVSNSWALFTPVRTAADLDYVLRERARLSALPITMLERDDGKVRTVISKPTGALLSIEGLQNLEGKRENLDVLFKAGYRMAGLAHFFDNELAGSMHGLKKGGLTPFGRQILADMEAKGMIVDIAHCSHACVADILAVAKKPVVSSHGGVQATCKVNRNLTDDEIRGVAKTGGVIGIGYWDGAICSTEPAAFAKAVRHVRDLVGIDHVGLGSDFDGATTTGFDTSQLSLVTQALMDEGFSEEEIAKVMGDNVLRVLMQVLPRA